MIKLDRRQALRLIGLGAVAPAAPVQAAAAAGFQHGVASGDPLHNAVVIWTRLTPQDPNVQRVSADYYVARADRPARQV